jgi:hypothetical protein
MHVYLCVVLLQYHCQRVKPHLQFEINNNNNLIEEVAGGITSVRPHRMHYSDTPSECLTLISFHDIHVTVFNLLSLFLGCYM